MLLGCQRDQVAYSCCVHPLVERRRQRSAAVGLAAARTALAEIPQHSKGSLSAAARLHCRLRARTRQSRQTLRNCRPTTLNPQGLMVILDNHSSDAIWCCGIQVRALRGLEHSARASAPAVEAARGPQSSAQRPMQPCQ